MQFFVIYTVIQEVGLHVYNIHNIVKKAFVSALHSCKAGVGR
jgi:hypothetical protein